MDVTAAQVAEVPLTAVTGIWQRHVRASFSQDALRGRRAFGRWGTKDGFPVLYLGRPEASVVVEAYRHLVDPIEDPLPPEAFAPRVLVTARVEVDDIIDLRVAAGRSTAGLITTDLESATTDADAYGRCQRVAQLAHQLGRRGLVAPAATGLGETLVLFTDRLADDQMPVRAADDQLWRTLPPDPRQRQRLRLVQE